MQAKKLKQATGLDGEWYQFLLLTTLSLLVLSMFFFMGKYFSSDIQKWILHLFNKRTTNDIYCDFKHYMSRKGIAISSQMGPVDIFQVVKHSSILSHQEKQQSKDFLECYINHCYFLHNSLISKEKNINHSSGNTLTILTGMLSKIKG